MHSYEGPTVLVKAFLDLLGSIFTKLLRRVRLQIVPFPWPLRRLENLPWTVAKHPVNGWRVGQGSVEAMPRKRARVLANENDVEAGEGHFNGEAWDIHNTTADNTKEERADQTAAEKLVGVWFSDVTTFET